MNPLREEREYAVREALDRERAAWTALERVARPSDADERILRAYRERWQAASHALVGRQHVQCLRRGQPLRRAVRGGRYRSSC